MSKLRCTTYNAQNGKSSERLFTCLYSEANWIQSIVAVIICSSMNKGKKLLMTPGKKRLRTLSSRYGALNCKFLVAINPLRHGSDEIMVENLSLHCDIRCKIE
jgi:hypothetical protein